MNRPLLTFFLICHFIVSQAQQYQYVPMPLSDGEWRYRFTTETGYMSYPAITVNVLDYVLRGSGADTTINGITYKKVRMRSHTQMGKKPLNYPQQHVVADNPEFTQLCVREDNKRVYWFDYTGFHDTLLFNFDAAVGDTIPRFYMYVSWPDKYKVYKIDTVNVGNILRKRFWANELYYNTDTIAVIEGIGEQDGGLMMASPGGHVGMYDHFPVFNCFTAPGIKFPDTSSTCYMVWPYGTPTSVGNVAETRKNRAYPNPFTDAVYIDGVANGIAALYNSAGIKVAELAITKGQQKINTTALPAGMYILTTKDEHGNVTSRYKLVK